MSIDGTLLSVAAWSAPPLADLYEFYLLILSLPAIAFFVAVGLAVLVPVWIVVRMLRRKARWRRAEQQKFAREHDAQGRPYPPTARDLCTECQKVRPAVRHMPDGKRLCAECYERAYPSTPEQTKAR